MTPIKRLKDKLTSIADNIRDKSGETKKMTIDEMNQEIAWMESEFDETETYILVDVHGNEIAAVATDEVVEITATPNDIRIGTTAVTGDGIVEGEKEIPSYNTYDGSRLVLQNSPLEVPHTKAYDYTKFQAIVCAFNTDSANSVAAIKVAINDNVYGVNSTVSLSTIAKGTDTNRSVSFGINNDSGGICVIRYIMYKEVY